MSLFIPPVGRQAQRRLLGIDLARERGFPRSWKPNHQM